MAAITIRDLPAARTLDRMAMSSVRGGGGTGGWVSGWIVPYSRASSAAPGNGNVFITNNFYNQFINANQATFQTQNTDVFNSGANAVIEVGASQESAISRLA